jgi:arylsulfatase
MTDRRNIVLITVDSLRADHCGFMGYDQDTTPYLDTLADESVVFDRAIAPAPFTKQSMPAIFTGQYHTPTRDDYEDHVRKRDTIAERLSRRGYSTAGFSPNPFASRNFGYDDGFDLFEDFFGNDSREKIARTLLTRAKEAVVFFTRLEGSA